MLKHRNVEVLILISDSSLRQKIFHVSNSNDDMEVLPFDSEDTGAPYKCRMLIYLDVPLGSL